MGHAGSTTVGMGVVSGPVYCTVTDNRVGRGCPEGLSSPRVTGLVKNRLSITKYSQINLIT